eukprot:15145381-Alexandrium_andersonii.AAC.1
MRPPLEGLDRGPQSLQEWRSAEHAFQNLGPMLPLAQHAADSNGTAHIPTVVLESGSQTTSGIVNHMVRGRRVQESSQAEFHVR